MGTIFMTHVHTLHNEHYAFEQQILTLKASIMTAADDKFCDILANFQKK